MPDAIVVNISEWIEKAHNDPVRYLERQATEIVLTALGTAPQFGNKVFLKGGALMGVVYQSQRQTADLDFSTSLEPQTGIDETIRDILNEHMLRAAAHLGYPDIIAKVQSSERKPRDDHFAEANFPALKFKIAYARRGSAQDRSLAKGKCPNVIQLDISFNEPVDAIQLVRLGESGASIGVYSLIDLIAEKLRALLQQPIRDRYRRQDVYDIALLLEQFNLDEDERIHLHKVFLDKCRTRDIVPNSNSLSDPEVIRRAQAEWHTLSLEIVDVPLFQSNFAVVENLYRSFPWEAA